MAIQGARSVEYSPTSFAAFPRSDYSPGQMPDSQSDILQSRGYRMRNLVSKAGEVNARSTFRLPRSRRL
jgi:hypothetical protein